VTVGNRLTASVAAGAAGPSGVYAILLAGMIARGPSLTFLGVIAAIAGIGVLIGVAAYLPYSYFKTKLKLHGGYDVIFHLLICVAFVAYFTSSGSAASGFSNVFLFYVFIALSGIPSPIVFGKILSKHQLWNSHIQLGGA
jgi:hypothetical protein